MSLFVDIGSMIEEIFQFGRHMLRCTEFGFWRKPDTMWASYIQPYLVRSDVAPQSVIDLRSSRARSILGGAMTFV